MKISEMMIMIVLGLGVSLGMIAYMSDLNQTYNIDMPESLKTESERILSETNKTTTDMLSTLTEEQSWIQTAYNIFFRSPVTMINTMASTTSLGISFISEVAGTETAVPVPDWVYIVIFTLIAIAVVFGLLMFVGIRG